MKNILNILFFFFLLCGVSLRSVCLKIDCIFETGLRNGTAKEFVYEGEKCISRLDWNDKIVPTAGFFGQIEVYDFFLKIEGGYKFQLINWYIKPSAGFKYFNRKWTASDGYL